MPTSWRTWVNLATVGVVAVVMIGVVAVRYAGNRLFGDAYDVTVAMERAGGIVKGQEVSVLGKLVGVVEEPMLTDEGAALRLRIQGDQVVPDRAVVQILRRSPVGEQVLNFIPVDEDFRPPAPGARLLAESIPAAAGWTAAERGAEIDPVALVLPTPIPRILEATIDLFEAIPQDALGTVVAELDAAIGGRGNVLLELNRRGAALNETLVGGIPEFERLIDTSDSVLRTLNDHADALANSFVSAADVSETLARRRPALDAIVTNGRVATDEGFALVDGIEENLSCLISDLTEVNAMLSADGNRDDLARLLVYNDDFWRAFDVQTQYDPFRQGFQWQRVRLLLTEDAGGQPYVPHRATPPTLPGAACESPHGVGVNAVRQESPQPPDPTSPGIQYAPLVDGGPDDDPAPPPAARDRSPLPATGAGAVALAPILFGAAYVLGRKR